MARALQGSPAHSGEAMSARMSDAPQRVRIEITPSEQVTAVVYPATTEAHGISLILAHGAGANQSSSFMVQFAQAFAARGIDTVTFNFLYTEAGRGVPDRNDKLEACYRRIIAAFHQGLFNHNAERKKLVIGGKSMGGRIASQVAAESGDGIAGLVLLGYPLHPPGRPDKLRTKHLPDIKVPMLFVQGARDAFGTPAELLPIIQHLKAPTELYVVDGGDHSFKVPKRGGIPQEEVYTAVLNEIEGWLGRKVAVSARRNK
jgi:predicted alpha/beta-hydrolase family hydrolase